MPKKLPDREIVKELVSYDGNTGLFTNKVFRGPRAIKGSLAGHITKSGYTYIRVGRESYLAHRLAWLLETGSDPGEMDIDHINGNPSDNSIKNLRIATRRQNIHNSKRKSTNKSGIKGVGFHGGRWRAQLRIGEKNVLLGVYDTKEEAANRYAEVSTKIYGEYARHN